MLGILVAEQTQGEVTSAVRSQFDHLSQLHWIGDIHPCGIILSVVLQWRWLSRHVYVHYPVQESLVLGAPISLSFSAM